METKALCGPQGTPEGVSVAALPGTHQAAAASLVSRATVQSAAYVKREMSASTNGCHPDIYKFSRKFIGELKARGIPMFAHEYFRDQKRQDEVYKRGNSKAKWGTSPHNFGMAVDIVHFGRYWNLTPKEWAVIGLIGKEVARKMNLKVTWGGDFKSLWDPAHWELKDWKTLKNTPFRSL